MASLASCGTDVLIVFGAAGFDISTPGCRDVHDPNHVFLTLADSLAADLGLTKAAPGNRDLIVSAHDLSFGAVEPSATKELTATLNNPGTLALTISETSLMFDGQSSPFSVQGIPATIPPGQTATLHFTLSSATAGAYSATLWISSDAATNSLDFIRLKGAVQAAACATGLSSSGVTLGSAAGSASFNVSANAGCSWSVSNDTSWISVTTGNNNGSKSINAAVAANLSSQPRFGAIWIQAGPSVQGFIITQQGTTAACRPTSLPTELTIGSAAANGAVDIAVPAGCNWSTQSDAAWLTLNPLNGAGTGTFNYAATAHTGALPRVASIRVTTSDGTSVIRATQGSAAPCTYSIASPERSYSSASQQDAAGVTTTGNCAWQPVSGNPWITVTGGSIGGGGSFGYTLTANPDPLPRYGTILVRGATTAAALNVTQAGIVVKPHIVLGSASVNLGDTLNGTLMYQSIVVQNTGNAPLQMSEAIVASGSTFFSATVPSYAIAPGGSGTLLVRYAPTSFGSASATISILSNDPDSPSTSLPVAGNSVDISTSGSDFTWTNVGSLPAGVTVDSSVSSVGLGSAVYLFGGSSFVKAYKYDVTLKSWTTLPDSPLGQNTQGGAAVAVNSKIYVLAGQNGSNLQIFDPATNQWSQGALPTRSLAKCAAAAVNNKIYVFLDGIAERFDPANSQWTTLTAVPTSRASAVAVPIGTTIYLIGGTSASAPGKVVEAYDTLTDSWATKSWLDMAVGATSRRGYGAAPIGSLLYVMGGQSLVNSSYTNGVQAFDPLHGDDFPFPGNGGTWSARNSLVTGRGWPAVAAVNGKIYVLGGVNASGSVTSIEEGTLSVSPAQNVPVRTFVFPDTLIGNTSEVVVSVQNIGTSTLHLSGSSSVGVNNRIAFSCPDIPAGVSTDCVARFLPQVAGAYSNQLQLTFNDPINPNVTLSFSGRGLALPSTASWQISSSVSLGAGGNATGLSIINGTGVIGRPSSTITRVNLSTLQVIGSAVIPGAPFSTAIQTVVGDSSRLYALFDSYSAVAYLDASTLAVQRLVTLDANAENIRFYQGRVYVGLNLSGIATVVAYDGASGSEVARQTLAGTLLDLGVDETSGQLVVSVDASGAGTIRLLDPITLATNAAYAIPKPLTTLLISGQIAYGPVQGTNAAFDGVDLVNGARLFEVPTINSYSALAADGRYLYASYGGGAAGKIDVFDPASRTMVAALSGGAVLLDSDTTTGRVYAVDGNSFWEIRRSNPTFTLNCDPSIASAAGASTSFSCSSTAIDGFAGSLTLFCANPPVGVTCGSSNGAGPIATGTVGSALTVSITLSANAPPGAYTLRLAADSGGISRQVDVALTVSGQVASPPSITTQPVAHQVVLSGQSVTLNVAAAGTGPLAYQWYSGPSGSTLAPVAGATSSSFVTPALAATTSYWVRVSNPFGLPEDSNAATVIVSSSSNAVSTPVYDLIAQRLAANAAFSVYVDKDSGFNHGFASGVFASSGNFGSIQIDPACIHDITTANGCSTNANALDRTRGTVTRVSFAPQSPAAFAGVNFEEPENWGVLQVGSGYDLRGATALVLDARSPDGASVEFGVGGCTAAYTTIPSSWTTLTIPFSALSCAPNLQTVHLLFSIATNGPHAAAGGTVLLDNIRFSPAPTTRASAIGFPLSNETFGVIPRASAPIPSDQVLRNVAATYESSLAMLTLFARGNTQDLVRARQIADAFDYAMHHDNHGGSLPANGYLALHSAYSGGDLALFNNQAAPNQGVAGDSRFAGFAAQSCGASGYCLVLDRATGGDISFAILALTAAYRQLGDTKYLDDARALGNWISASLLDTSGSGYGGYVHGYSDLTLARETGKSTENNADIFAAFTGLAAVESALGHTSAAASFTTSANIAGDFVMQMFDAANGRFNAGTVPTGTPAAAGICPNGAARGGDVINTCDFLDPNTFAALAMGGSTRYRNQIDWHRPVQYVLDHFAQSITVGAATYAGFNIVPAPTSGPNGVAWEFTAQAVAAMRYLDYLNAEARFDTTATAYGAQIAASQTAAPFGDGLGLVASTLQGGDTLLPVNQCLQTPFQCIAERVGIAASTWAALAEQRLNVFLPDPRQTFPAQLTSPAPGSKLIAATVLFQWNAGTGGTQYTFEAGTSPGTNNLFSQNTGTNQSVVVSGLPANSSTIYVRLGTLIGGAWQYNSYIYTASSTVVPWLGLGSGGPNKSSSVPASNAGPIGSTTTIGVESLIEMLSPAPGSSIEPATARFTWSVGLGVEQSWLIVRTFDGVEIYNDDAGSALSAIVNNLPPDTHIEVVIGARVGDTWYVNNFNYFVGPLPKSAGL